MILVIILGITSSENNLINPTKVNLFQKPRNVSFRVLFLSYKNIRHNRRPYPMQCNGCPGSFHHEQVNVIMPVLLEKFGLVY